MIRFCEKEKDFAIFTRKSAYFAKNCEKISQGSFLKKNIICVN